MVSRSSGMLLACLLVPTPIAIPQAALPSPPAVQANTPRNFDSVAEDALASMRARAGKLKVTGVAVVAYMPGETLASWSSKMMVVGRYKDLPTATDKGSNLLAFVYEKAAEMADTLKDSGSGIRPPLTGEVAWQGGVIAHGKSGYLIAAFSGGKSEDDVQVSRAGLERLKRGL